MPSNDEGMLSDGQFQNEARRLDKRARRLVKEGLLTLQRDPHFVLWVGRLFARCGLTDDLDSSNGSVMFRFAGRRSVAIEVLNEIETVAPGFFERVLAARRAFEAELSDLKHSQENDDE